MKKTMIYCLDHDLDLYYRLEAKLNNFGVEVVYFDNSYELLRAIKLNKPCLCLISLKMNLHKEEGLLIARAIKNKFKNDFFVICMLEKENPVLVKKLEKNGFDDYYVKRKDEGALLAKVRLITKNLKVSIS